MSWWLRSRRNICRRRSSHNGYGEYLSPLRLIRYQPAFAPLHPISACRKYLLRRRVDHAVWFPFVAHSCLLSSGPAPAQFWHPLRPRRHKLIATVQAPASPAAYVYVSSSPSTGKNQINAYAAAANGALSPIPGTPFSTLAYEMAVTENWLFATDGSNIDSFSIAANGALEREG